MRHGTAHHLLNRPTSHRLLEWSGDDNLAQEMRATRLLPQMLTPSRHVSFIALTQALPTLRQSSSSATRCGNTHGDLVRLRHFESLWHPFEKTRPGLLQPNCHPRPSSVAACSGRGGQLERPVETPKGERWEASLSCAGSTAAKIFRLQFHSRQISRSGGAKDRCLCSSFRSRLFTSDLSIYRARDSADAVKSHDLDEKLMPSFGSGRCGKQGCCF